MARLRRRTMPIAGTMSRPSLEPEEMRSRRSHRRYSLTEITNAMDPNTSVKGERPLRTIQVAHMSMPTIASTRSALVPRLPRFMRTLLPHPSWRI